MTVLELECVTRVYGSGHLRVTAVDSVSLRVRAGEFVAVMGPSGSGKSTLLRLAGGLDRPTSGRVLLSGRDLAGLDEAGLATVRRREVGFVFQEANLLPALTAAENVALALELDRVKPRAAMIGARDLLDWLGLAALGNQFPARLSGGEQQRVAIARAVAGGRSLLLADEPTGALDAITGESVMSLLGQRCATGCAIVLVTHNVRHAAGPCAGPAGSSPAWRCVTNDRVTNERATHDQQGGHRGAVGPRPGQALW
jgi:putative ABC transport system ATP-binding protein